MNHTTPLPMLPVSPDDPRVTAFALGELEGVERAAMAEAVDRDPQLARLVEEIRCAAEELTAAFASETASTAVLPEATGERPAGGARATPAAGIEAPAQSKGRGGPAASRRAGGAPGRRRFFEPPTRFPYLLVGGLAAAVFAVAYVGVLEPRMRARQERRAAEERRAYYALQLLEAESRRLANLENEFETGAGPARAAQDSAPGNRSLPFDRGDGFVAVSAEPLSSFPVEVETSSYAEVRRHLEAGTRPPAGAVRIEHLLNSFAYDYAAPPAGEAAPFAASLEVAAAPWEPGHRLARIGLKGRQPASTERAGEALVAIARDVKIQVEFNPAQVQAYRLIGYENGGRPGSASSRDNVNGGRISAGHTVTALYEIIPADARKRAATPPRPLRYQPLARLDRAPEIVDERSRELFTVEVHYQQPTGESPAPLEFPLTDGMASFDQASPDFRFASSVAAFGMILQDSAHRGSASMENVVEWAEQSRGTDADGRRSEFVALARTAVALYASLRPATTEPLP